MKTSDQPGKKSSTNKYIGLGLLLGALALFIKSEMASKEALQSRLISIEAQKIVNRHLQQTSRDLYLKERRGKLDSIRALKDLKNTLPQQKYVNGNAELNIRVYNDRPQFNQDIGRGRKDSGFPADPFELVQTELFQDQKEKESSDNFKKEYARQFVENAKKHGWNIQIDSKFRIISVQPFKERRPTQSLFNSDGTGGR